MCVCLYIFWCADIENNNTIIIKENRRIRKMKKKEKKKGQQWLEAAAVMGEGATCKWNSLRMNACRSVMLVKERIGEVPVGW